MKKDREIMHNDKKDSELIAEYYDKYEQKLYRLSYAVLGDIWQAEVICTQNPGHIFMN